ncbi:uncharacterized protein LOC111351114 [Spodoptera litura]|uniref:Uncharacterized protein LOC111351114 n=1 Tax=Spodoptera litura TaxID=69820 RepID=A0A9J7DXG5_SPOLT|nr:uncharacterized protein LOC111351114 [Spodoptera litura]
MAASLGAPPVGYAGWFHIQGTGGIVSRTSRRASTAGPERGTRPVKQVNASIDKELKSKRRQLDSLLCRPIYPRGFSFKYSTLNNDTTAFQGSEENALQVMKNALESGQLKKEKRKSKNAPLLQLQKKFKKK